MKRPLSLIICILLPIIILLVGIIFSVVYAVQILPEAFRDDKRGLVPPGFALTLDEAQKYSIWVYSRGVFEGKEFQSYDEKLPPGAEIHVIDKVSGKEIPLSSWITGTKSTMKEDSYLLGAFETLRPQTEIEIVPSGIEAKTVIGISSKDLADHFQAVLSIVAIFFISLFFSIATLVVLLHRRNKQIQASEA